MKKVYLYHIWYQMKYTLPRVIVNFGEIINFYWMFQLLLQVVYFIKVCESTEGNYYIPGQIEFFYLKIWIT